MPHGVGNGGDFSGSEDMMGTGMGTLRRKTSASGMGAFSARSGTMGSSTGAASPTAPIVSTTDSWLVQKLKNEWSSCDLGPLLTKERLSDAVASFPHLDTPIKVRLLLSFLNMRKEDFEASKFAVVEIVDAAEKDSEEWVKVGAGIVNQYLFMSRDGAESGTFLHEHLARASATVLDAIREKTQATSSANGDATRVVVIEDFFCHENAYLSASVRPELAVQPAAHFTIAADAPNHGNRIGGSMASASSSSSVSTTNSHSSVKHKPPTHRPQLTRPSGATAAATTSVPIRTAAQVAKPAMALPPKKNMSELSSEIRRKADAGRFKRQRSRISVIDIDEVKQIESEKAQKAEEQKKRLKATKDEKKTSGTGTGNGVDGAESGTGVDGSGEKLDGDDVTTLHEVSAHEMQYSEQDDPRDSDRDDGESNLMGQGGYTQDGTQALLHAAFHSTGDVMKEVVAQQHQPYVHQQQHDYYHQRQATVPQQALYGSRGFEPEDAHVGGYGNAYGYGAGYASQFGDQTYADGQQYAPNNVGFGDEQTEQQGTVPRYDNSRDRGGFLDGPPEYWR